MFFYVFLFCCCMFCYALICFAVLLYVFAMFLLCVCYGLLWVPMFLFLCFAILCYVLLYFVRFSRFAGWESRIFSFRILSQTPRRKKRVSGNCPPTSFDHNYVAPAAGVLRSKEQPLGQNKNVTFLVFSSSLPCALGCPIVPLKKG